MKFLVVNCGSSSIKYQIIEKEEKLLRGLLDGIGTKTCRLKMQTKKGTQEEKVNVDSYEMALKIVYLNLKKSNLLKEIKAVGHRVVHGGEEYSKSVIIDSKVIKAIKKYSSLAPLHNPINLGGILFFQKKLKVPHVAVFDTAYHHTIPKKNFLYALPSQLYHTHGIRKYGFHGISHQYVVEEASRLFKKRDAKIISCHLGNGSSINANYNGKSIDTSLGFATIDGVIMATRAGSFDPGIVVYLFEKGFSLKEIRDILYNRAGLFALCGQKDLRIILKRKKEKKMRLALDMLCASVAKFIGSFATVLNGVDAVVFTAGIGENAWEIRERVCKHLSFLGVRLNKGKNKKNAVVISTPNSKVRIFVIPTDEEKKIAEETERVIRNTSYFL